MFFDFEKLDVYQVALDFVRDDDLLARGRDQPSHSRLADIVGNVDL